MLVSNCLSLVAYYQSMGKNIQQWCSDSNNYQKCCITCQSNPPNISKIKSYTHKLKSLYQIDYLKLKTCADIAYEPDCKIKAQQGLCNTNLSNNIPVSAYCPKSCNVCKSSCQLTCDQVDCNTGTCCATSYFSQPSVQCTCPSDRGGTYCQLGSPHISCIFTLFTSL
jgi:hypothetical protein